MKSRFIWIVVILIIFAAVFWFTTKEGGVGEDNIEIARNWVMKEASTYVYDGNNIVFKSEEIVIFEDREAHSYTFTFESRHGGYGDRTDKIVIQVITPHEIKVITQDEKVISAVTDGVFDELNKKILE